MSRIIRIDGGIIFDDGYSLYALHEQDCCEDHYLDFSDINFEDVKDLEFDLTKDDFFERIPDYGIALKSTNNFPLRIPGYSSNNGYYSSNLTLVLENRDKKILKEYDIEECQKDTWY